MDIKAKIEEIVEKVKNDDSIKQKFTKNPIAAVEELLGVNLPDDQIQKIVEGVKAKISVDGIASKLGGLGGLFGKK